MSSYRMILICNDNKVAKEPNENNKTTFLNLYFYSSLLSEVDLYALDIIQLTFYIILTICFIQNTLKIRPDCLNIDDCRGNTWSQNRVWLLLGIKKILK